MEPVETRLSFDLERRIDALCDRFEARWAAGDAPRIEDYLRPFPAPLRGDLLLASVQGEGSNVQFHAQLTEEVVNGMTIMVLDDVEAIFINIEGSISAADLGRLAQRYGISDLMGAIPADSFPGPQTPPANDGN